MNSREFIEKAKKVHGDKYDYSKVEYINAKTKVCIICPEHGEFWIEPSNHLNGRGCPNCARIQRIKSRTSTTEEFIKKACEVHGDKYDYSKVEYINAKAKVCIICPEHGEFWQSPNDHLNGRGCPNCARIQRIKSRTSTIEEFIKKAHEVHGNKYDYSKVEYINAKIKVCIICPEHGEFCQEPSSHLSGCGCPKCDGSARLNTDDFIEKAKKIHGDKYDYSKVEYKNSQTKVCIICPEHGEFWQIPSAHLSGAGCPKCGGSAKLNTDDFIEKAKKIHGDKYDYSKVEYKNSQTKVCIICPEHGEFWQTPSAHLSGQGCPNCVDNVKLNTDDFIEKAKKIHGDKYDYSKVEYKNSQTKVCIICPEHGEFWQSPNKHLMGQGCPNCQGLRKEYKFNLFNEFVSEFEFRAFLANNDVNILRLILSSLCELEPKYAPLEQDIQRILANANNINPIEALEQKYSTESESDSEGTAAEEEITVSETPHPMITIDLDNDNDVYAALAAATKENNEGQTEPSIEDVIRNVEQEIQVINRIEHMLTPEIRSKIMYKYLNDKRRAWMAAREKFGK